MADQHFVTMIKSYNARVSLVQIDILRVIFIVFFICIYVVSVKGIQNGKIKK